MSSPITAQWECSRMSTFLSSGTISMRETAQSVWLRQRELKHMASEGQPVGSWRGSMSSLTEGYIGTATLFKNSKIPRDISWKLSTPFIMT